jgi:peptide deformylase
MALRNIVQIGDETLRKKCFEVTDFGEKTHPLLEDMKQTLKKSEGVGLAAPQVGVLRRIFVISLDGKYYECINPKIIEQSGKQEGEEACLSVRGKSGVVVRPNKVTLVAFDRNGKPFTLKGEGLMARAICHENDHLDGILYIDRAKQVKGDDRY